MTNVVNPVSGFTCKRLDFFFFKYLLICLEIPSTHFRGCLWIGREFNQKSLEMSSVSRRGCWCRNGWYDLINWDVMILESSRITLLWVIPTDCHELISDLVLTWDSLTTKWLFTMSAMIKTTNTHPQVQSTCTEKNQKKKNGTTIENWKDRFNGD